MTMRTVESGRRVRVARAWRLFKNVRVWEKMREERERAAMK
jgi:hypothetical protein